MAGENDVIICPFKIIPIKEGFDKNKIIKVINKILLKYHPDKSNKTSSEKINLKIYEEYNEISKLLNLLRAEAKKGNLKTYKYREYKKKFSSKVKKYSDEDIKIILNENSLDTKGSRNDLEERIINNVPSLIVKLNLKVNNIMKNSVPDLLNELSENKLIRILELKNIQPMGDKFALTKLILHNINNIEILNLINQVNDEILEYKLKLNELSDNQLQKILTINNLNSYGTKNQMITKILENIKITEINSNIEKVTINKEKILEELYKLTGKDNISPEFRNTLKIYGLEEYHGNEIKNILISKINQYKLSSDQIESELNTLLRKKSGEVKKEILNELYIIIGKNKNTTFYSNILNQNNIDSKTGLKIKNEIINEINDNKIKKDEIKTVISKKINIEVQKIKDEKLNVVYEIIGKSELNSNFKQVLSENELNESVGFEIKEEIISLINKNSIKKEDINHEINELLINKRTRNLLLNIKLPYLNQIAILNDITQYNNKEKQINCILENISSSFNDVMIKENISKIDDVEKTLNQYYKKQIEDLLIKGKLSFDGVKKDLIDKIISKMHLDLINLYINEINKFNKKLNQLTILEIKYILKNHDINIKGNKNILIKEINKKFNQNDIKDELKTIEQITNSLFKLKNNELLYISHENKLSISDNKEVIIKEIRENIDILRIEEYVDEIKNIELKLNSYSDIQLKHVAIINNLELFDSKKEQINEILEKGNFYQIMKIDKKITAVIKTLNSFNINQLHYILDKNNQKISINKTEQIKIILDNILLIVIERDIQDIFDIKHKLNNLTEDQIEEIIELNRINKSLTKEDNIYNILELIPMKTIKQNINSIEKKIEFKGNENEITFNDIKNDNFINPIKLKNSKKSITTVKQKNLIYLLLLDKNEYDMYINNTKSKIVKLEKPAHYFMKFVKNNNNIDGILFKTKNNNFILKKESFEI